MAVLAGSGNSRPKSSLCLVWLVVVLEAVEILDLNRRSAWFWLVGILGAVEILDLNRRSARFGWLGF